MTEVEFRKIEKQKNSELVASPLNQVERRCNSGSYGTWADM